MISSGILLGLDIGGSSIKGGLVDVSVGRLVSELHTVPTPQPASPDKVMLGLAELARELPSAGPVGVTYPGVVQRNRARTAAHVDPAWLGTDGAALATQTLGRPAVFLNDADAAGIAEMRFGAGRDTAGTVMMVTLGTGIGTSLFTDGKLLPNTELGHLEINGIDAEEWASARIRTALSLDFPTWTERVNLYLARIHALLWPDVFILGGAVSERFEEFAKYLRTPAEIRPAHFAGQAGTIGAAIAAVALG
jgi:polyphosphate glucokinase